MFQFPAFALCYYFIHSIIQISLWVPPFGYPRINAYSQLPAAFRSVLRLSSPLIAKASTKCPYLSLDSYNINIKLALIFILLNKNLTFYPFSFTEKRFLVYISILLLPRFLLIIQYITISYYSASSLFTMFYNYP